MKWKVKDILDLRANNLLDLKGIENCLFVGDLIELRANFELQNFNGLEKIVFGNGTYGRANIRISVFKNSKEKIVDLFGRENILIGEYGYGGFGWYGIEIKKYKQ